MSIDTKDIIVQWNRSDKKLDEIYAQASKKFSLNEIELWILYLLRESDEKYSQSSMRELMCVSKQTLNSALKRLEDNEFITFEIADDNRRKKYILLTKKGIELAKVTADKVIEAESKAFEIMGLENAKKLITLQEQFRVLLNNEIEKL